MTTVTNMNPNMSQASKRWVLASNNKGKLAEFKRVFKDADLNIDFIPQATLGIEDAVEDRLSFIENAILKARHASRLSNLPALADDSGLCVPILGNAPGIYSARYAGEHGDSKANNAKLIADLAPYLTSSVSSDYDNPSSAKVKAYFVCVLAMVRHADDPLPLIAQGLWHGEITDNPQGKNGFGYDPIFWVPEQQKTAAQLAPEIKNQVSHRGQAIGNLLAQLTAE